MSSKSDILKRIASIRRRGAKFDNDVHETAVLCLDHAKQHRDVTLLAKLVAAMPRSGRREALVYWCRYFAPVKFNQKEEAFRIDKKREEQVDGYETERQNGRLAGVDMEGATARPFFDLTPEKNPAPFDLDRVITNFANRLKKAKKEGKMDAGSATVQDRVRHALNTALAES